MRKVPAVSFTGKDLVLIRFPMSEAYTYIPDKYANVLPKKFMCHVFDVDRKKLFKVMCTQINKVKGRNVTRIYVSKDFMLHHVVIVIPLGVRE